MNLLIVSQHIFVILLTQDDQKFVWVTKSFIRIFYTRIYVANNCISRQHSARISFCQSQRADSCEFLLLLATRTLPAFEHTSLALSKTAFLTGGCANSGALDARLKFRVTVHGVKMAFLA
jgi:hypothetical protein